MTIEQKSFSSNKVYNVTVSDATNKAVACSCPDYYYRSQRTAGTYQCKHIRCHEENRLATIRMMQQSY